MKFNIIDFLEKFENKRLTIGEDIKSFLLAKLQLILQVLKNIISSKNTAFYGPLFLILLSLFLRSSRDIGHDSAAYLEIGKKMLDGGKYSIDFFEPNLPFSFILSVIANFLSRIFSINNLFTSELLLNIVGISSIYFSSRILKRSKIIESRTLYNLIILALTSGFFIRVFTLQFNEFFTKTTLLLAFLFPYISYQLLDQKHLKKSDDITAGIFSSLLFFLKPHYGIFVIFFEIEKVVRSKSLFVVFCFRNYVTLGAMTFNLLLLLLFFPGYFAASHEIFSLYFDEAKILISLKVILKIDIFPILLLSFLCSFLIKRRVILQKFFIVFLAASFLLISELIGGLDQRFILYSTSLPLIYSLFFFIFKGGYINWKKDYIFLILIICLFQFDQRSFSSIAMNIGAFWWIFVLVAIFNKKDLKINYKNFFEKTLFPQKFFYKLIFIFLIFLTFYGSLNKELFYLTWLLSALLFSYIIAFYQKSFQVDKEKFSRLLACAIFTILSYLIAWHLMAIFNLKSYSYSIMYNSPSYANTQIIKSIKVNAGGQGDQITLISGSIPSFYPAITYANKENPLPFLHLLNLYHTDYNNLNKVSKYQLERLKKQIKSKKNKVIFIIKSSFAFSEECHIGFLENIFTNGEFKNIFLKNYKFSNRIVEREIMDKKTSALQEQESGPSNLTRIKRDIEVYVRK